MQSLIGEIFLARKNFDLWQPYLARRLETGKEHTFERGIATSLIVQTSLIAERSIKTLLAQVDPDWQGAKKHNLQLLFDQLDPVDKQRVETQFKNPSFASNWIRFHDSDRETVQSTIAIANNNFEDWRYTMERDRTSHGIPGPLLKSAAAISLVCIWHLLKVQDSVDPHFPIKDLPFDVIVELA